MKLMKWLPIVVVLSRFVNSSSEFSPTDSFLISCGSSRNFTYQGRIFVPDSKQSSFLLRGQGKPFSVSSNSSVLSPIYKSMRVFPAPASYAFDIRQKGRHWIRLYFYPIPHSVLDLESSSITVVTDEFVLLNHFSFKNYNRSYLFKEYVINVKSNNLTITFIPSSNSVTFVNGIEVVSVPDELFSEQPLSVFRSGPFGGLSDFALETIYRLNMGGPSVSPQNDTLGRTWENDDQRYLHLDSNASAMNVTVSPSTIKYLYPVTPQTAPNSVYASAVVRGYSTEEISFFNITWDFPVDPKFTYFVRLHFCDIISKALHKLIFNVYINYDLAMGSLDLTIADSLAVPYFQDFIIYNTSASDVLTVSIGPNSIANMGNSTMNGAEIMKISNYARSLDGFSSVGDLLDRRSSKRKNKRNTIGFAIGGSIGVALILICSCWCLMNFTSGRTHQEHSRVDTIASIWKPSNYHKPQHRMTSLPNQTEGWLPFASSNLSRLFTFQEIMDATNGFDESLLLGVGGFGRVYMGTIEDGTKVAIKRANPMSRQGNDEFQTEIKILSKARHRHLVSLLGYCGEHSEMILVYEFMANGTLRNHLYGTDFPSLSWKQRLKICIGAARGLHYLHTGAAQCIIHRDVKTTNILLDENFEAKVADFGLSKIGPGMEQTHVSTIVKGTLGYFDPEYIRRQQLTAKSDVYSFGVVLMEVLCARPVLKEVLPSEEIYIVDWAMNWRKKGMLENIIDPNLVGNVKPDSLKKFSETAEKCLAQHGADRPTMENVLSSLEGALQLDGNPSAPPKPDGSLILDSDSTNIF